VYVFVLLSLGMAAALQKVFGELLFCIRGRMPDEKCVAVVG
jgi:hypothetical protein